MCFSGAGQRRHSGNATQARKGLAGRLDGLPPGDAIGFLGGMHRHKLLLCPRSVKQLSNLNHTSSAAQEI
jgi:hypothetical protein